MYDISVSTMCIYRDYCVYHYKSTEAIEWFLSYLSDRRMAVKIKELVSELQVVKYGVPQG